LEEEDKNDYEEEDEEDEEDIAPTPEASPPRKMVLDIS
jgi:hypothetical protein